MGEKGETNIGEERSPHREIQDTTGRSRAHKNRKPASQTWAILASFPREQRHTSNHQNGAVGNTYEATGTYISRTIRASKLRKHRQEKAKQSECRRTKCAVEKRVSRFWCALSHTDSSRAFRVLSLDSTRTENTQNRVPTDTTIMDRSQKAGNTQRIR